MGIWSVLFPGDEGVLADLFWSNQQTSSGINLDKQIWRGTSGDDTVSFAQLSFNFNPYQSEVYLNEGNDSVRTAGTPSGTKFYLAEGDDFFTALDGLRFSRIESGSGDDTIRIKESLLDREGLFRSILATEAGNDYILIEKEDRLADSRTAISGGGIFSGDGDDRLVVRGNGLLMQSSGSSLTYADGSTSLDGIINLGEGKDFLGIEKWDGPLPSGSMSAGSSPYLLDSDIDLGGGSDTVDLRSLDFSSSTGVLIKGGEGYDVAILPVNISGAPNWLQGFEAFTYAINNGNGAAGSITGNGAVKEGVTLTAGTISGDPDGDGTITAYQWYFNNVAINGATSSNYATGNNGIGTYKVALTYTDGKGYSATIDSPEALVNNLVYQNGTDNADQITANPWSVARGGKGDDQITGNSEGVSFLVGGEGSDTYNIKRGAINIIIENANAPGILGVDTDTIVLPAGNKSNPYLSNGLVDNRHYFLWYKDLSATEYFILIPNMPSVGASGEAGGIEKLKFPNYATSGFGAYNGILTLSGGVKKYSWDEFLKFSPIAKLGLNSAELEQAIQLLYVDDGVAKAPTDLALTSDGILENSIAGTVIGNLSATDPDAGSSFTYALVAGDGSNDADNNLVEIVGSQVMVKSGASIDFETNPTLNLKIQVTDNGTPGLTYAKAVTANVIDLIETSKKATIRFTKSVNMDLVQLNLDDWTWKYRTNVLYNPYREVLVDSTDYPGSTQEIAETQETFNTIEVFGSNYGDDFDFYQSKWDTSSTNRSKPLKVYYHGGKSDDKIFIHGISPLGGQGYYDISGGEGWDTLWVDTEAKYGIPEFIVANSKKSISFDAYPYGDKNSVSISDDIEVLQMRIWEKDFSSKTFWYLTSDLIGGKINAYSTPPPSERFVTLASTLAGTKLIIGDTSPTRVSVTTTGSADLIEIKAEVSATLNAITTENWGGGYVAFNVGSTLQVGTGERISLEGLGKYSFVATAINAASSTIVLEQGINSAFFLHDAYSAFYEGLTLTSDSTGRQSAARILDVDVIKMGSAGGTSIVDLTSKDYLTGAVTVYGADKGRSVFWGTDSDDTFVSGGGDSVIFGGGGFNQAQLGAGKDILQFRSVVDSANRIQGFDPTKDALEFWRGKTETVEAPTFMTQGNSTMMTWGNNTMEFEGITGLSTESLMITTRIAL
jgi:hypothetical protein